MIIEIAGGEGLNHESRELLKRSKELDDAIVEVREDVEDVKEEIENITTDGLDISKSYSGYSQEGTHTDTSHYTKNTRTGVEYNNEVDSSGMRMTESPQPYSAEYETQDFELKFSTTDKLKGTARDGMVTTGDYKVVDSEGNVTASLVELNNDLSGLKVLGSHKLNAHAGTFEFEVEEGVYMFVGAHSSDGVCVAYITRYNSVQIKELSKGSYAHLSYENGKLKIVLDYGHSWSLIKIS